MNTYNVDPKLVKPKTARLIGVLVPTSRASTILDKWGESPNLIIPINRPKPHPRWGKFVWIFGVNHQKFTSEWLNNIVFDLEISLANADAPEEDEDIVYFPSKSSQERGETFWASISRLEGSSDLVFQNESHLAESGSWHVLQENLLTLHKEAEDKILEEIKSVREFKLRKFFEEGKEKELFSPEHLLEDLLSDDTDLEKWWDISHTVSALDNVYKSFAVALGSRVKEDEGDNI